MAEPFDEKLQEEVNQKEKELKDYIAQIVEMRKKIPQEMQLLIQEMTEKQASETDVNLETTVDIPGIQRGEYRKICICIFRKQDLFIYKVCNVCRRRTVAI